MGRPAEVGHRSVGGNPERASNETKLLGRIELLRTRTAVDSSGGASSGSKRRKMWASWPCATSSADSASMWRVTPPG